MLNLIKISLITFDILIILFYCNSKKSHTFKSTQLINYYYNMRFITVLIEQKTKQLK